MCLGVPGKVIETFDEDGIRMGTVDFGGIRRKACLEYAPEVDLGSWVVIHVGFAISTVNEEEAARSYALLDEMDNLEYIDLPQDPDGVRPEHCREPRREVRRRVPRRPDRDGAGRPRSRETATRPWTIMEVCGGQTHTLIRQGIDQLLAGVVELVHGPGCPVCVTPLALIDEAIAIAKRPDAILCSFGDMLRVPGSSEDLFMARAVGGDVRVVYSPLDALEVARRNPDKTVVFFAVGFETTAPANAMAVQQATRLGVTNFALLVAHVLVPPAIMAILVSPGNRVQGFLAPGHVCAIQGWREYEPIARDFGVPLVVTGFEPIDLLEGIRDARRPARGGPGRGREPVRARGRARREPGRAARS